jgi:hypothetical protein
MERLIVDFVSEFKQYNESTINGCCGLTMHNNYHDWLSVY